MAKRMKKFLIIGNANAITYKEIFPLIKDNKLWLGTQYVKEFVSKAGEIKKFGNILWHTNLVHKKRNTPIDLYKHYNADEFPHYDNYDAIEVGKVSDIPMDYDGVMGVPITFLGQYCPTQFEIIGFFNNYKPETANIELGQIYGTPVKVATTKSLFRGPVVNGKATYFRILIKKVKE